MRSVLVRSTPLRRTIILGATFFLALLLGGAVATHLIERQLEVRIDRSIADTFTIIAQAFGDSDQADLIDSVNSHAGASINSEHVFALATPDGSLLAGNVARIPGALGWQTAGAAALELKSSETYRIYVGDVQGNHLLVGQSFAESNDITDIVLWSAGWASALALLLVAAAGIAVALRAQSRIDGIARTMTQVGHGELAARIPVSHRGDDIDQLAAQVNRALDRLGGLVEGMRHVSVNIAHDLKTPLNRLAITLEGAGQSDVGKSTELLGQAQDEIRQINATFDALLRIAQIEAGARRARFVPIRLGEVLERIADAYGDVAEESGQSLSVHSEADLPAIEGDAELLIQLSANLIENSIRHAPAGTQITVVATRSAADVVATFADNGQGIPEAERGKVFERLYRIDKSRSTPGSGLGLSLVKAIADLHGATIEVGDSHPGLKISIRFPGGGASL
ncbi:MAG: HAMP domain-containing sensor histidine kinase [Devosia sp.]